jgi:hypothetical protein
VAHRSRCFYVMCLLVAGCAKPVQPMLDGGQCARCRAFGAPTVLGATPERLNELSGLVASRRHPGVYFGHNDSGDKPRFVAFDESGREQGTFNVEGVTALDWEDATALPNERLAFGDIGDNERARAEIGVVVVEEPSVLAPDETVSVSGRRYRLQYPGGQRYDAESLVANPQTGQLYVLTKGRSGEASQVFRVPLLPEQPGDLMTLELVGSLAYPSANDQPLTAADVSPCGDRLLLRTYGGVGQLTRPDAAVFEELFTGELKTLPHPDDAQGESIAFQLDGLGYVTGSEAVFFWPLLCISFGVVRSSPRS